MSRVYNFGAGPATLPEAILKQAQSQTLDWQELGMSVMEVSHRSAEFMSLLEETTEHLIALLNIPSNYHVLWMGVPARYHFSAIVMNFLNSQADYVISGTWSKLAYSDAEKMATVNIAATNAADNYLKLPENYQFNPEADFCYFRHTLSSKKN